MTCQEARKLLYDRQVSRSSESTEERATMFALAQAHLHVCLACNEYFELERAFVSAVRDRITPLGEPMPAAVLQGALHRIQSERMTSVHHHFPASNEATRGGFWRRLFGK